MTTKSLKTLTVSNTWLIILVSKYKNPKIIFEPLYPFLHHLFNPWPCYKPNKVHIDWWLIAMVFIKLNFVTRGCDWQRVSKKKLNIRMSLLEGSHQPTNPLRIRHHRRINAGAIRFHPYPYHPITHPSPIPHHYLRTAKLGKFMWIFLIKHISLSGIAFYTDPTLI